MAWPTGATRLAGVIGDPVRHSLSPALHNAAFSALGLDWAYVAFPVPAGRAREALVGAAALGIDGLSVTMPHKSVVAAALGRCSPTATTLGAVNTVVRQHDELIGENTDGQGFIDALRSEPGFEPSGRRCLVIGAGGAARAVVLALAQAGAAEVVVVNRTLDRGRAAAALAGAIGRTGQAAEIGDMDLVVHATPVGMTAGSTSIGDSAHRPLLVEPDRLGAGQVLVDLVYQPATTALMEAAHRRGATAVNGVGMLVHQAALAFELWTGEGAPLEVMRTAATEVLQSRGA
ncbi:MAG TPA: shikimate dehydrogenase [Acidimicrobiales bacterium]|nr:shikimate dehydrogenase [Acidimicrobiales bacterium]